MNEAAKAAYIIAQAAALNAEVAGMQAENQLRATRGEAPCWYREDFQALIERYGCHHNAVITFLNS